MKPVFTAVLGAEFSGKSLLVGRMACEAVRAGRPVYVMDWRGRFAQEDFPHVLIEDAGHAVDLMPTLNEGALLVMDEPQQWLEGNELLALEVQRLSTERYRRRVSVVACTTRPLLLLKNTTIIFDDNILLASPGHFFKGYGAVLPDGIGADLGSVARAFDPGRKHYLKATGTPDSLTVERVVL